MDFRSFIDDHSLTESLNSPQEFYMTDDTKLPMQVHAAFSIDGDENSMYVISLVQSKTAGMYILDVGRTPKGGGKSYYWKFHSPSDLRPVLSTLVKFVETSMQLLGPKLKGIAVRFRMANTKMMEVSERIATKMIKKSYMKSMKIVPVKQPEVETKKNKAGEKGVFYGKTQRYLFIAKKVVAPATIFKAKNFKTLGYDFDLTKGLTTKNPLPYETLAELKPKVVVKPVKSLTPSKKYAIAGLKVQLSNDDIVDVIGGVNTKDTVTLNHDEEKMKEAEKAKDLVDKADPKFTFSNHSKADFNAKTSLSIKSLMLGHKTFDDFAVWMALPVFNAIRKEIDDLMELSPYDHETGRLEAAAVSVSKLFLDKVFKEATKMDVVLMKDVGMFKKNGDINKMKHRILAQRYYDFKLDVNDGTFIPKVNGNNDTIEGVIGSGIVKIRKVRQLGDAKSKELASPNSTSGEEEDTLAWIKKPATMPQKIAAIIQMDAFNTMVTNLLKHGYDESKFSEPNLKYVVGKLSFSRMATLDRVGLPTDLSDLDAWREVMKAIASYTSITSLGKQNAEPLKKMKEWLNSDNAKKLDGHVTSADNSSSAPIDFLAGHTIIKSTSVTAEALHDTINDDPFGPIAIPGKTHRRQWHQDNDYDNDVKVEAFLMDHFGSAMEKMPYSQKEAIHRYSSSSSDVNNALRSIYDKVVEADPKKLEYSPIDDNTINHLNPKAVDINNYSAVEKCQNLLQCFEDLPTTPENMWVYRGTDAPYNPPLGVTKAQFRENLVPGEMYWDGGFMSTSIRANIDFASQIRFRFYLPKGTPVVPLLTNKYSPTHHGERELILRPGSTFKIIERNAKDPWETSGQTRPIYITAVYVGSIHHDVREKAKSLMKG